MEYYGILTMLPNLVCAIVALWISYKVYRGPSTSYRVALFAMFIFVALTALVLGAERLVQQIDHFLLLVVLEYASETGMIVCLVHFVINYTGHGDWLTRARQALIVLPGMAVVMLNATNHWHGLFYNDAGLVVKGGVAIIDAQYGPLFILWAGYFMSALILCIILLYTSLQYSSSHRRRTTGSFIMSLAIIVLGSLTYILYQNENPLLDILSITLTMAALAIFFGERNFTSTDAELVTARETIHGIEDAILVVNNDIRAVFANQQGQRLLDTNREVLLQRASARNLSLPMGINKWESALNVDGEPHHYSITTSDIIKNGKAIAAVLVFNDITDRKRMEDDIRRSNRALGTLNQIVRHDIRNDLTAIWGYLELLQATELNDRQSYPVRKMKDKARSADSHLSFAKAQQSIGCHMAVWQDLELMVREALDLVDTENVEVEMDVSGIKLLADPMLPNVFHSLADNSVRHGERVTRITIRAEQDESGLNIIWQDDGAGVRAEDKERIFDPGFGRNTGEGLYIAREVLLMTDASIREEGEPGKGARFVIDFPSSRFIMSTKNGSQ